MFEKDRVGNDKSINIRKITYKIDEILAKYRKFFTFKNFTKVQSSSIIRDTNFLSCNIRIVFTKLRQVFI